MRMAIIQTGQPTASGLQAHGDFDRWFVQAMQLHDWQVGVHRVDRGAECPSVDAIDAVIVTGSPAMVTDRHDWALRTQQWLEGVLQKRVPTLAVCFGHQLVTDLLGGRVGPNPNGRQIGQACLHLTAAGQRDPLLSELSDSARVPMFVSHLQVALTRPRSVQLLGYTEADENHCFSYNDHLYSCQFHPEMDAAKTACFIHDRAVQIRAEGGDPQALIAAMGASQCGQVFLQRFRGLCERRLASGASRCA